MEVVPFVLRDCLEEAVGIVAGKAAGKGIALEWQIGPGVPAAVESDAGLRTAVAEGVFADRLREVVGIALPEVTGEQLAAED